MTNVLANPFRATGLGLECPFPHDDASGVAGLLHHCPAHAPTPLLDLTDLAGEVHVARIRVKDERSRMGLGSFKALGAAHAIARDAADKVDGPAAPVAHWNTALNGRTYVTASAGNHGLSVAAGAAVFGAAAVVYLAETVPESFAARLRAKGARVVRAGATYEASMAAAATAAEVEGWTLLSDSSWPGYMDLPYRVMEGYVQLAQEVSTQIDTPPTHILLQAGVGGFAAAIAAHARRVWGPTPTIVVVEPTAAPALIESIRAGALVETTGPTSAMGRLDCKAPSMIALQGLARDADLFVTISEEDAQMAVERLAGHGIATSPSGAAGLTALLANAELVPPTAQVLAFLTEGAQDD